MEPAIIFIALLFSELPGFSYSIFCNVAYRRQTSQSSFYYETVMSNGYACNAVDGLQSHVWSGGSCTHSAPSEVHPWWQVDLGASYTVAFVNISVRTDYPGYLHYDKINHTSLTISETIDANGSQIVPNNCATDISGPSFATMNNPYSIPCMTGVTGRYLRITQTQNLSTNLQFCEVEVYADISTCPDPPQSWSCRDLCYDSISKTNTCPVTTESATQTTTISGNIGTGNCMCPCESLGIFALRNMTDAELIERIAEIIKNIKIDEKDTVLGRSKLNSAEDDRPSAKAIGSMGVLVLVAVVVVIVMMDFNVYIKAFKTVKKILNKEKRFLSKK